MRNSLAKITRIEFWSRGLPLAAFAFAITLTAQPAAAGADAEKFTQGLIDRGFAILRDGGGAAHNPKFHEFVVQNVDAEKTALFALGQYRRGVSAQDLAAYVEAFRDYVTAIYESRLEERQSQELKVVGSLDNKPGDVTVTAQAKDPNATDPIKIAFRLLGANGSYKVVDVQAAGVWISIDERDQFATLLSKDKGDVKALTAHLVEQTAQIRAGKKT